MALLAFLAALVSVVQALELSDLDDRVFETIVEDGCDPSEVRTAALYQITAARLRKEAQPVQDQPKDELGHLQALDWSYDHPEAWVDHHPACGGDRQSPINIATEPLLAEDETSLASLLDYSDVFSGLVAENTGTAIQVSGGGFGRFSLPDGVYEAIQFHFHFPAEHAIDGHIADGELHIVHQKIGAEDNDDLAVIGVLLRVEDEELARNDDAYPLLAELGFLSGLPRPHEQTPVQQAVNLKQALQKELVGSYYHYQGSLTTPPCSESVHWYVLSAPALITQSMVDNFKDRFPDPMNNRPLQPLNDRLVSPSLQTDADEFAGLLEH